MRAPALLALVIGVLVACTSQRARAEDLAVVALGGDAPTGLREHVLAMVAARFEAGGFSVVAPIDLMHRVPASRLAIESTDDAARLGATLGVPRIACVSVWVSDDEVRELSLSLHALSGERSVHYDAASGSVDGMIQLPALVDRLVAEVLGGAIAYAVSGPNPITSNPRATSPGSSSATPSRATPLETSSSLPIEDPEPSRPPASGIEPLFGFIGPTLLAAVGAAGIGLGVWASLDTTCDAYNADRSVCLRGEAQNLAAGIPLMLVGAVSLAGAIAWWVLGSDAPIDSSRIEVGLAPDRLLLRGRF